MLEKTASQKLVPFYPNKANSDKNPQQQAWRLKTGCLPKRPCGQHACSMCHYAARKLHLRRAGKLHELHPTLKICKVVVQRKIDISAMSEKVVGRFQDRAPAMATASTAGQFAWRGMFRVEPAWNRAGNYTKGLDATSVLLTAEFFSLMYPLDWILPPAEIQAAGPANAYQFNAQTAVAPETLHLNSRDLDLHYAKWKKAGDIYTSFGFKLPDLMDCLIRIGPKDPAQGHGTAETGA